MERSSFRKKGRWLRRVASPGNHLERSGCLQQGGDQPLREIRILHQKPAHTFTPDIFSAEYHTKRKQLLWSEFESLSNIPATFAKLLCAGWLDDGSIDVF